MSKKKTNNSGFTIVELMIATAVFSIVLVVAATGIMTIGRLYYKGITSSRTQEASRSVIDTITEAVQFNSNRIGDDGVADTVGTAQAVCFGYDRYTYVIDSLVGVGVAGLRYDKRSDLNTCPPSAGGEEIIPSNMSLLRFNIDALDDGNFRVMIKVSYGDRDLQEVTQCSGTVVNGNCHNPSVEDIGTVRCRGGIAGNNFCGVSELETIVNKRVE